ncbi:hypothetical protein GWI33_022139 [Rhynchophorus ferrugineus]|uniref:Uncharacterized protein n=1 Tax=Rhynchophorus ferrugineus TaxID=354439 RepID=A0A834MHS5_RHYFE|nr:hypothetical protein GWI33_022139 [Rhynchophorus ferrugineus]
MQIEMSRMRLAQAWIYTRSLIGPGTLPFDPARKPRPMRNSYPQLSVGRTPVYCVWTFYRRNRAIVLCKIAAERSRLSTRYPSNDFRSPESPFHDFNYNFNASRQLSNQYEPQ